MTTNPSSQGGATIVRQGTPWGTIIASLGLTVLVLVALWWWNPLRIGMPAAEQAPTPTVTTVPTQTPYPTYTPLATYTPQAPIEVIVTSVVVATSTACASTTGCTPQTAGEAGSVESDGTWIWPVLLILLAGLILLRRR